MKNLRARTSEQLEEISGWTHDAELLEDRTSFDAKQRTVEIRFEQELLEGGDGAMPRRSFVARSWWSTEYRVPFVLCRLRVRSALGPASVPAEMDVGDLSLLGTRWEPGAEQVTVFASWGRIEVPVDELDVELEITDEVVTMRRRWVGRIVPWTLTRGSVTA